MTYYSYLHSPFRTKHIHFGLQYTFYYLSYEPATYNVVFIDGTGLKKDIFDIHFSYYFEIVKKYCICFPNITLGQIMLR